MSVFQSHVRGLAIALLIGLSSTSFAQSQDAVDARASQKADADTRPERERAERDAAAREEVVQALATLATQSFYEEQSNLKRGPQGIAPLDMKLFGDHADLYTGALHFQHVDVSLPGNSALPVEFGRKHSAGRDLNIGGQLGTWDLAIPHMKGNFATANGWVGVGNSSARCSSFGAPGGATSSDGRESWPNYLYWSGNFLSAPGADSEEVLTRTTANTKAPTDGNTYPLVTKSGWQIRCLPSLANGSGEGFLALSPDGVQYRFDWLASRFMRPLSRNSSYLARNEVWIMPTQVRDRFGNTVTYTYDGADPWKLLKIEANDGRRLTIGYISSQVNGRARNLVDSVTDGVRTWRYGYDGNGALTTVTRPDSSQWVFDLRPLATRNSVLGEGADCYWPGDYPTVPFVGTVRHPSGAQATYTTYFTQHGQSGAPTTCWNLSDKPAGTGSVPKFALYPGSWFTQALTAKQVTGPGLPTMNWSYEWSYAGGNKLVTERAPGGRTTRYTYGIAFGVNAGQQLQVDEGWDGSAALRTTAMTYRSTSVPWPEPVGNSQVLAFDPLVLRHRPVDSKQITQQGALFKWQATSFDTLARPTVVTKSGSGVSRTETTTYYDHLGLWVLGQVDTVTSGGLTLVDNDFHATTAMLASEKKFGVLQYSYGYHADGNLQSRTDGRNFATTYSSYKRGLPQSVSYPNSTSEGAVVNDLGLITSVTNAAGYTTGYGYDAIGRLASITPPAGFTGTTLVFQPVGSTEYGLSAGHWRQTVTKGNAKTVSYFDGLWRPVMTRTFDAANEAATRKVIVKGYGEDGDLSFVSYPQRDLSSVAVTSPGTRMQHDALGRLLRTEADSELGTLVSTSEYLSGLQVRQTNARNLATTQTMWALDNPADAQISTISAPEGVTVTIARDDFGKPMSITRGGVTRRYVYDAGQRLCKTIEPEVGATVQDYDGAGNVAWRAPGQALLNASSCDTASAAAGAKISYGYDPINQLTSTSYGDGSPAISRTYWGDGRLKTVVSNGASWSYTYNGLRQPLNETLNYGGLNYAVDWGYNAAGNLSSLTYPNGEASVAYNPNALGEPTMVGSYASAVAFHPNGGVASYTLGNGIAHQLVQNSRGLPLVNRDVGVMQDQYGYDGNGNVTGITDQQLNVFTRSMTYDGLDRLKTASAPNVWGAASYTYDAADNLRTANVGTRNVTLNYTDGTNRLNSLTQNGASVPYSYDAYGNIRSKGAQTFGFDLGNRLTSSSIGGGYVYDGLGRRVRVLSSDGSTRIHVYSQAGQLMWSTSTGGPRAASRTAYVYLGGKQIAEWNSAAGVQYVHTDALGSPVARSNASAVVTNRTRFEPYGYVAQGAKPGPNISLIGFTGHVQDAETDLVYMQQRYFDPMAGRFLSSDPVVADADTGAMFGRYHYANNNPYRFVDPDGQACTGSHIKSEDCAGGGLAAGKSGFSTQAIRQSVDSFATGGYGQLASQSAARGDSVSAVGYTIAGTVYGLGNVLTLGQGARAVSLARSVFAAKGTTPLFRAVGPVELADVQATGALRNLGSAEGKYFTTSASEASAYAKQAVKSFGDSPYTIIRTDVPNSIFKGLSPAAVDRGIPAWVIPTDRLQGLVPSVMNHSPLPPVRF
ncbi:MAG: RHS repeat domain-containing protein [Roseateles sp.]